MYWPEENSENADRLRGSAAGPNSRLHWLGWYLFVGYLLLMLSIILSVTLYRSTISAQISAEIQLTEAYASPLTDSKNIIAWIALVEIPDGYEIVVVGPQADVIYASFASGKASLEWIDQISRNTRFATDFFFYTNGPNGDTWLHTWAVAPAGVKLVLQKPNAQILPLWHYYVPPALIALAVISGLVVWYFRSERWVNATSRLVDLSETIRWRGYLHEAEQTEFRELTLQPTQIGRLATSLLEMAEETQTRLTQLSTLLETGRSVTGSLDVDQIMDNLLAQVQRLFGVERCAVITLEPRADVFRIRASRGISENYVENLRISATEPNSPSMRALRKQSSVQVVDTETDLAYEPFRQRARDEGNRSILAIPLVTKHAKPAVLLLYKNVPYRYSYGELELATLVSSYAVLALENAALFAQSDERLQEQTRRLDAIVESMHDGLILESLNGQVLYCNQQAATFLGLAPAQIRAMQVSDITNLLLADVLDTDLVQQQIKQANALATSQFTVDLTRKPTPSITQDIRIHFFSVTDARGEPLGRGQLWQDVTSDKELDRMKSSLLSTVSHELRTPLANIKGYASTLLASDVEWDPATQRDFLSTISAETDRLTNLVQDLLDMSRIEAGTLDVQCEPYSLNHLVPEVIQAFPKPIEDRIKLHLADQLPITAIDLSRMSTVIRNLIENAAKYSPAEKGIELYTYTQNGDVVCTVRDYGQGIPPQFQEAVFERFIRVDNRLSRQQGGFGLGLAICKGFVEAHNGTIWLQKETEGMTFGFALPIIA
ncbi:MAG: ATP-binding protein [Chloroflexota bacterium]